MFLKGTENFEGGNLDENGGALTILHKGESVMTKEENKIKEDNFGTKAEMLNAAMIGKRAMEGQLEPTNYKSNYEILKELREVKSAIENKPALSEIDFDRANESVIYRTETKSKILRNHIKIRKLA
jgi:hypothetical protein